MAAKNLNSRKRKGCQEIVFEIDEDDISPANSPEPDEMVNSEPSAKVARKAADFQPNLNSCSEKTNALKNILLGKDDSEVTSSAIIDLSTPEDAKHNIGEFRFEDKPPVKLPSSDIASPDGNGKNIVDTLNKLDGTITGEKESDGDICDSQKMMEVDINLEQCKNVNSKDDDEQQPVSSLDSGIGTDDHEESLDIIESSQKSVNTSVALDSLLTKKSGWIVQDETFCSDNVDHDTDTLDKTVVCPESPPSRTSKEISNDEILQLKNTNALLQKELVDLRHKQDNCSCQTLEAEGKALINIQMLDSEAKHLYKKKIVRYFRSFSEFFVKTNGESNNVTIYEKINKKASVEENGLEEKPAQVANSNSSTETSPRKSKKKKKKKTDEVDSMFVIDTAPSLTTNHYEKILRYSSKFTINENDHSDKSEEENSKPAPQNTCFNCDEKHNLKDCPHPRDFRRINQARSKMKDRMVKSVRYHLEEDQKFAHIRPGKISDKLRDALGVDRNELPPYIYKMRELGYPPGWKLDAQDFSSSLSLFDLEGKDLNREANRKKMVLDADKVIEYPGFNIPTPKGIRDHHKRYACPPYSRSHSKENMIKDLKKVYNDLEKDNLNVCDMEVCADDAETKADVDPKSLRQDSEENSQQSEMSLADLERQKNELLAQLDESSEPGFQNASTEDNFISLDDSNADKSFSDSGNKSVKDSTFGTPILRSSSQFSRLPNLDNFTKDVSPVINFENLPNSTGKYEQMTNVLAKVRKTMKGLNETKSS